MRVIYQPTEQNEFRIGGIESFREAAARNHFQAVTRVVHFAEDVVDQKTAEKTGLPLGSDIYDVRRIRYLEGKALILDINLFLREAVPDLTPEIAAHSIYDYIENDLGMTIVTSRRRMTVERAGALAGNGGLQLPGRGQRENLQCRGHPVRVYPVPSSPGVLLL